ncbi:hypothetical protein MMC18_001208 [Xylographa bjoerkii]|nr:hypothetical protein [Xylographa bjoerkii]
MATQQTAPTQYIKTTSGTTFAYRQLGSSQGIPLVMHIHFRGTMDFWDPLLINALAATRPVIIFDPAGVGRSSGKIPLTFQGWADDLIALVRALGLFQVDLFGFSMGGKAAQMVALTEPGIVRKLILAGTSASQPPEDSSPETAVPREMPPSKPIEMLASADTHSQLKEAISYSFFNDDKAGRAAAKAYWERIGERKLAGEPSRVRFVGRDSGAKQQLAAAKHWSKPNSENSFERLGELKMPVLVVNGDNDTLIPSTRSWELMSRIENAQLIIYPRAGHGFLYQYADLVSGHVNRFLDGHESGNNGSRL